MLSSERGNGRRLLQELMSLVFGFREVLTFYALIKVPGKWCLVFRMKKYRDYTSIWT